MNQNYKKMLLLFYNRRISAVHDRITQTRRNGLLTLLLALFVQLSFAQEKTVSGTVSDESGALPGVSVIIKGTSTGTDTDFDGKYSIKAKTGDVLVYSYIGYKTTERIVGTSNTINVVLEEGGEVLDEIVVTALGIKRDKKSLGFAQQSVKKENLVRSRETDVNNALAGKVAGVQFVGAPSSGFDNSQIRLRGNRNVLYIVDNVKVSSTSDVNTDDIEDISVLKGSAASALYGPEGINGVVIITTRSAKNGESTVKINHSTVMESVYSLPEYQNEYGGGYSQDFNTFTYNASQHPASWAAFNGQQMVEYYADESWGPKLDGTLVRHWDSWIEGDSEFGKLRPFSAQPNNVEDMFDTGVTTNTSISFSKGGEDYTIRASISNIDRTSIVPNSDRNTVLASISTSIDITDKLTAYANVNYQDRRTKNNPDNGYGNIASNVNQWWQRQLDISRVRDYKRNGQFVSWNINSPSNTKPLYWDSPFFEFYENVSHQTKNSTYGKIGVKYDVNDDLNISLDIRKTINSYEFDDRFAFGGLGTPSYAEAEAYDYRDELFGIVNYSKDLNNNFDITATAGFELSTIGSESITGQTVGGLTTENFYSLSTSVDRPILTTYVEKTKTKSIFGKASIGYKDMLYLDASVRYDWSSTAFADNNRVETYGGSFSFIFTELLPKNDIISFGKFRLSAAQAPRFPLAYQTSATYGIGIPYGNNGTLSAPGTYANPLLEGGTRNDYEIGTELRLFKSRLGVDFTYFKKEDSELPVFVSLDGSTGYNGTLKNDSKQTYSGIELGINYDIFRSDNFRWDITLNVATLERFVDAISDGVDVNVLSNYWRGIQLQERAGEEWGAIYGRAFRRDDDGNKVLQTQVRHFMIQISI